MKTKPMRLWAVVIDKKGPWRYVVRQIGLAHPLAVFESRKVALIYRNKYLLTCNHKDVYVIPFESK